LSPVAGCCASQSKPHHFAQLGAQALVNSAVRRSVSCSNHGVEWYAAYMLMLLLPPPPPLLLLLPPPPPLLLLLLLLRSRMRVRFSR
jgi:hypothetical protein